MINLIDDLFLQNGFICQSGEGFKLYHRSADDQKKEFWVIPLQDFVDILAEQAQLYRKCKALNVQQELDKNISLLMPVRVEDEAYCKALKSEILRIEEDSYFFKKHVVVYSDQELADFRENQADIQTNEYLIKVVAQQSCFEVYKANPKKLQWQSLVYRLASKIPFIQLKIKVNKDLTSLYELKAEKVAAKQLSDFEQGFEDAFGETSYLDLSNTDAVELINQLNQIFTTEDGAED